jgi:polyhydroxyalkanoate synthase
MAEQTQGASPPPKPEELAKAFAQIAEHSQRVVNEFLKHHSQGKALLPADDVGVANAFMNLAAQMWANPMKLAEAQMRMWHDYMRLWHVSMARFLGEKPAPVAEPSKADNRFKAEVWENNFLFDYIKQSYLIAAQNIQQTVADVEGLDPQTARKTRFFTRQFVDALAPTNFLFTNPDALKATVESGGRNLIDGLHHLLEDLERGGGRLAISMTDYSAFELGKNVATAPGKVVYQTDLMQLIQYSPSTDQVWRTPLLIIPPWINKFYILDLREKNSFIRWATAQGHTVFVISWVNPDQRFARKGFDDYMLEGPLAALKAIEEATGEREVNVIGYCLGGTLLACLLSWLQSRGDKRIKSATFFTAMIDFTEPGELGVFVDEPTVTKLERKMAERGYLEGSEMATTFNLLRANDLIWSFVVNNYLLGKDPFPFDLLFWNSDSTRMPARMHTFYLRNMYIKNLLTKPGSLMLAGEPIDVTAVTVPACFVSTIEDHIAPWKSTYLGAKLLGGPVNFILAGSGHIAGVVNPPSANKYYHWTNEQLPGTADEWLSSSQRHDGSWWNTWAAWVARFGGDKVPARVPGSGKLPVLEDAPGSYVKLRLDVKQHAPAAPQTGLTTQQLLAEVSQAVAPPPASAALLALEEDARDELKDASRSNRARREHDQLAAHDAPAPAKAKRRSRKQT